jgi:hypothetical protein
MSATIPIEEWRWFGSPMHCIVGPKCRFHLGTQVGNYLISTIGEYYPNGPYEATEALGHNRYYELMVFPLAPGKLNCGCPIVDSWSTIDGNGWPENTPHEEVSAGHLEMCRKYAEMP